MAKKKTKEIPIELEREYIVPLRKSWLKVPRYKRAPRAINAIRQFIAKHMKVEERDIKKVKIDKWLNQEMWFRGIKKPPAKIKVKAIKKEGVVTVALVDLPDKVKFAIAREKKKAEAVAKKKAEKKKAEEKVKAAEEAKKKEVAEKEASGEKKEEDEKKEAVKEAGIKAAKAAEKAVKHQTIAKQTQPKRQQRKALGK